MVQVQETKREDPSLFIGVLLTRHVNCFRTFDVYLQQLNDFLCLDKFSTYEMVRQFVYLVEEIIKTLTVTRDFVIVLDLEGHTITQQKIRTFKMLLEIMTVSIPILWLFF